jgi:hypothetical protein
MGLNDKLKLAATSTVVEKLMAEGHKYDLASPKTRRRWKYVAIRRLKELQVVTEKQSAVEKKTTKAAKK